MIVAAKKEEIIGGKVEHGPIKELDRIAEKAAIDYGGEIGKVGDIVRSRFVVKNELEMEKVLKEIKDKFSITKVGDNWGTSTGTGFRNINIKAVVDGKPVEIQIVPDELVKVSNASHELYEEKRKLENIKALADKERRAISESIKDRIKEIDVENKALNNKAWETFINNQL